MVSTWIHDAVRKAAAHHLLVDIHDSYRPSGFTRSPAGPADVTLCVYDQRLETTRAHQAAMAVIADSPLPLLSWYDRPAQFDGSPELAVFDHVPTVWGYTHGLHHPLGDQGTLARRSGRDWLLGTLTGATAREISIPLAFLPAGNKCVVPISENGDSPTSSRVRTENVTTATVLRVNLPAAGG